MKAIFIITREIHIDESTYVDIETECYSNLKSATEAMTDLSENNGQFDYCIKIINLVN